MPNGKVIIGYSFPMVGKYVNNNGTVTYTDSRFLARGVDCAIQPDQPSDTGFYADNIRAESDPERLKNFSPEMRRIRAEWRLRSAETKKKDASVIAARDDFLNDMLQGLRARAQKGGSNGR